ncbi:hypothetical protein chiPu_0016311 [Chiloscyllium punctatum]|uniref:Uncharacterized protein n=1 Tax=Chiloscyllium punctatum TaxID=137246 RepID=A0A401T5D5_CHIPU|nr:hypothetical protein [Chiloscyllium punctatum]
MRCENLVLIYGIEETATKNHHQQQESSDSNHHGGRSTKSSNCHPSFKSCAGAAGKRVRTRFGKSAGMSRARKVSAS